MHGFVDVTVGALLGLAMSLIQIFWLPYVERWVVNGGWYGQYTLSPFYVFASSPLSLACSSLDHDRH